MKIFATRGRRLAAADPGVSEPELSASGRGCRTGSRRRGGAHLGIRRRRRLFRRGPGPGPRRGLHRGGARRAARHLATGDRRRSVVRRRHGAAHGVERDDAGLPPPALLRRPAHRARQPGPPAQPDLRALPPGAPGDAGIRGTRSSSSRCRRRDPSDEPRRPLHPRDADRPGRRAGAHGLRPRRDDRAARQAPGGDPHPPRRAARSTGPVLRTLLDGAERTAPPRVWIEGLPGTDAVAGTLLDELARG